MQILKINKLKDLNKYVRINTNLDKCLIKNPNFGPMLDPNLENFGKTGSPILGKFENIGKKSLNPRP